MDLREIIKNLSADKKEIASGNINISLNANYFAQDIGGQLFSYKNKPELAKSDGSWFALHFNHICDLPLADDWLTTILTREEIFELLET